MNKQCTKCRRFKRQTSFVRRLRNSNGYSSICKKCHCAYMTQYKLKFKDRTKSYCYKSVRTYQSAWELFLKKLYGVAPVCGVCSKKLHWFVNKSQIWNAVCFDHRRSGAEDIKTNPKIWMNNRPCTEQHQKTWLSCNFGILCNGCNSRLPTQNREAWLRSVNKYVFGENK